jgi:hypothetical protein
VYENINYWDDRGDYENASVDFSSNYYSIDVLHEKYHPNGRFDLCADFMNDVINNEKFYKGLNFNSMFLKTIWFYSEGHKYYAIVEFNESYRSTENLTSNRRYIYCGISLEEVDYFLSNSVESYGDKFHRIIKPNKCRCD